ncbi:BglG family transcription antiterminator LicT [Romboutsia sp. 1001285H_161024_C4]|uniref:BglG family transcription antiterminator LicT n=1 Tax=Romboutsia sp. 1001285H_161024_C4 TaxID=2787109 RepID=UPI0018984F2A|nr:PRD domain-containing protein [Romboutsia sp. 1001285H_161024_C4]
MIIDKIVNNNVVTVLDSKNKEAVVMGRGIGFKKKPGDLIDKDNIEKIFTMDNPSKNQKLIELLENTPSEYLLITEEIVKHAQDVLGKKLNSSIYVLLTDHIVFAVDRFKENIVLQNPMIWEIKTLYKDEYRLGQWSINLIKDKLDIELPEDEAAFIALHIVNASLGEEMYNTMNITILTKDILKIIKTHFNLDFNEDSLDYIRLVTHLKFFSQRVFKKEQLKLEDDDIYNMIVSKYKEEKNCVDKISKYTERSFNYTLSKQEIIYLILHIKKVSSKN